MNWLGEIGINSEDIAVIFPTHLPLDKKTIYTAVVQINGGRAQLIFGLRGLRNINFKLRDCGELWKYPVVFQDGTPGETTVNKGQIRGLVFK